MEQGTVAAIVSDALQTILLVSLPMLGIGIVVGLLITILQTATSLQEQTIVFVAKIVSVFAALLIFGPWMLTTLGEYFNRAFEIIVGFSTG